MSEITYCARNRDNLKINNGMWRWFSWEISRKSAMDYLIKVKGTPFMLAVETILGRATRCLSFFMRGRAWLKKCHWFKSGRTKKKSHRKPSCTFNDSFSRFIPFGNGFSKMLRRSQRAYGHGNNNLFHQKKNVLLSTLK